MMIARRPSIRGRRPKKPVSRDQFLRLVLSLPNVPRKASWGPAGPLAFLLLLGGFGLGAWWPREASRPAVQEDVFVFEEEVVQALLPLEIPSPEPRPTAPPPPRKGAPKEEPTPKPPPRPHLGPEETNHSDAGDRAVAPSPSPPPTPAPVFVDKHPGILMGTPPEYPPRALERGLEATVVALVTIDTNGRVTEARIEQGAGRYFDGPVLEAVRRLRFQPVIREGRKWPARFRIPYEFKLE